MTYRITVCTTTYSELLAIHCFIEVLLYQMPLLSSSTGASRRWGWGIFKCEESLRSLGSKDVPYTRPDMAFALSVHVSDII